MVLCAVLTHGFVVWLCPCFFALFTHGSVLFYPWFYCVVMPMVLLCGSTSGFIVWFAVPDVTGSPGVCSTQRGVYGSASQVSSGRFHVKTCCVVRILCHWPVTSIKAA